MTIRSLHLLDLPTLYRLRGESLILNTARGLTRGNPLGAMGLLAPMLATVWRFWRGYVLRGGFLDGWHGLVYAYVRANYVRQKTIMLWMLQNGRAL